MMVILLNELRAVPFSFTLCTSKSIHMCQCFESALDHYNYLSKKEFGQTREGCLQMSHSTEENFFPHILGFDDIQWISNKTDREKPES